jgi:hypothetical protein
VGDGYRDDMGNDDLLGVYLNDHLAAATAAVELCRRSARSVPDQETIVALSELADELDSERDALRQLMQRLSVEENRPLEAVGWLGEKLGRLKPNGSLVHRSPLSDVVELEGLRLTVQGKLGCWRALRVVADHDPRVAAQEMDILVGRAEDQARRVDVLHRRAVERSLVRADSR